MSRQTHPKAAAPFTYEQIYQFCEQLSVLFAAGITPIAALEIMLKDTDNKDLQGTVQQLYKQVLTGASFSDAVRECGVFPEYVVKLLTIGEQTGRMDVVTSRLADYYENAADTRASLRDAVSYPILMIVLIFAVIIVLLQHILPIFSQIFAHLGGASASFVSLMNISRGLSQFYTVIIVIFAIFIGGFLYFYYVPAGQAALQKFSQRFKLTRGFAEYLATGRFADSMEMTQAAGLDTFVSLDLCRDIVDNDAVRAKIDRTRELLQSGESFSSALIASQMFSPFYAGMLNAAAATGNTDRVMGYIARHYKQDANARLSRLIAAIEPTMVIILSVIIGLILLSLILPLLGIMSSIG